MTAPDPTAGEHHPDCYQTTGVPDGLAAGLCDCRVLQMLDDAAPPPAVAASTGTSEDVETLAKVILAERLAARELPNTYMDDAELLESMKLRARAVLASDWLAARDAAARAEGAAVVRDDIRARRREFRRLNADREYLNALDDAYGLAANRAREVRP